MRGVDAVRSVLLGLSGLALAARGQPRVLDERRRERFRRCRPAQLVAGLDGAPADGRDILTLAVVAPGERVTSRSEEPGPGGWALYVNRERVVDSRRWLVDGPMDFLIDNGRDCPVRLVDD